MNEIRFACALALVLSCVVTEHARGAQEHEFAEALVIGPVGRGGRSPVHTDAIEAMIVAGTWSPASAGDVVTLPDGREEVWQEAAGDPWFSGREMRGGWALVSYESPGDRVMLLDAAGHSMVYVNGVPRGGDVYATGKALLPVMMRQGHNDLLFKVSRGRMRAKLAELDKPVFFSDRDTTVPDIVTGERDDLWGAIVVVNATDRPLTGLRIRAGRETAPAEEGALTDAGTIAPMTTRKTPFRFRMGDRIPSPQLRLDLLENESTIDSVELPLTVKAPDERHNRTFISGIDGSVQYYTVTPAHPPEGGDAGLGLILTLHGAGVEASGQAAVYSPKEWAHVVAPTNRRFFGFDWEDWGRIDAMEVLDDARRRYRTDPRRTYLTGHSMGGHGTWQVGATLPDRFAAIGPSAGWVSFWSYTGAFEAEHESEMEAMLRRAAAPSDTLALARNYLRQGVYVLHGDRDDNVPVEQARTMRTKLAEFHPDFAYYEQPGAGHWWGNACCDWPPMMEFLRRHELPPAEEMRKIEFHTASPGVSASCDWVTVEQQARQLVHSSVVAEWAAADRLIRGTTENVALLSLDISRIPPGGPIAVDLDGQRMETVVTAAGTGRVWVRRTGGEWEVTGPPDRAHKGPHRYGSFKDAFRNRVVLVHGTAGTDEENAWSYAKARFDAEAFWYRGNGSFEIVADTEFDPEADPDRNVVVYGNAQTNAAWESLLDDGPVRVTREAVDVGGTRIQRSDVGVLLIRPRPGSDVASVGVVGGTGLSGMRMTDQLPYFLAGVHYADLFIVGPRMLEDGAEGVAGTGFFGPDWSVEGGEFVWSE